MKNKKFLSKLKKENKISLVEPSIELKDSYKQKSISNLQSSRLLLEGDKIEEAVYLAYYSIYNILLSLLFRTGIKSENHTASIIFLKEIYGLNNKDMLFMKKERKEKQYYVGFKINKEEVEELLKIASNFNSYINDFIERLNNEQIEKYRKKFSELTG